MAFVSQTISCAYMLSIQSSRGRMWNQVDKNLGLFVMIVWQLLKWLWVHLLLGLHEALVSCLSYLTLRLCWAFALSWEPRVFYLELSWSFLISSGLVFALTWLLGTWMRVFVLLLNLLCWALVFVNAFIKGKIMNTWWSCAHVCVMNDWHMCETFEAFPVESYFICAWLY